MSNDLHDFYFVIRHRGGVFKSEKYQSMDTCIRMCEKKLREFEGVEGQSDEVQLKALAKVNKAFDKIRHSKLGYFLEKTKWFA